MRATTWLTVCLLFVPSTAWAGPQKVDYVKDIKPILAEKCFSCHGALKQRSRLRMDAAQLLFKGGRDGPPIVPGKADESLLVKRVLGIDGQSLMPPEGEGEKMSHQQVALLKAWINQGANAPVEPVPPDPREHWAYKVPQRPAIPQLQNTSWVRNPIDAFLAAKHEEQGLAPAAPASKEVLLRRVYFDLIGLPPTRDELHAFLEDKSDDAYEKVVDRLLASQRYGERWGRHWMDVWRYSDWSGYRNEIRNSQPHIWRWRDWIIESLNGDKGYDRMIIEMLAGDEIAPEDPSTLRATGYLVRNWYKFNRNYWLDNTVEHTMKAFLAVTINCTRCHEHKYDPISQRAYYELRAIFEPHQVRTDRVPGQLDTSKDGLPRAYDADAKAPTYLYIRGNEKHPDKSRLMTPGVPSVLGGELQIEPVDLPLTAYYPHLKDHVVHDLLEAADREIRQANQELAKAKATRDQAAQKAKADPKASPDLELAEEAWSLAEKKVAIAKAKRSALSARIEADRAKYANQPSFKELALSAGAAERQASLLQAEYGLLQAEGALRKAQRSAKANDKKSQDALAAAKKNLDAARKKWKAAQDAMKSPSPQYTPLGKEYPRTSTGRRLAFARWLTNRNNPLTARVAVNHIWLRHFGAPIVENVFDFGLRSPKPRHAQLLDWLAVEFMENGWSMKHLHRLMVTSNAYRMSSNSRAAPAANLVKDPDNHYFWRMNSRRLEAELVRDSLLYVAGNLDLTMGGPDIDHNLGESSRRRSVYFRHAYEKKMKFLELFDVASENECYRRSESIVPQQALALANSTLSLEQSRLLARKLHPSAVKSPEFVIQAFEQILARKPSAEELKICTEFLARQRKLLSDKSKLTPSPNPQASKIAPASDPILRARENLVHVLMNHNDFVTIR
ncbi:MAG: cytochrome c [Gemmatales bacterium]|nr:MAG: cytochrome c [Gemmatales bacterium]